MDVFLKKYFWVVNLLVTGICAALAGRAGSHLTVQAVLMEDVVPAAPRRTIAPLTSETVRTKEIEGILDRNIFCSTCQPAKPAEDVPAEDGANAAPQRSSLQLELVSTMVVPGDERWSMAVIRDLTTKERDPSLYAAGSQLLGGQAQVLRVIEKRVYIKNGSRTEYLEIDGAALPPPGPRLGEAPIGVPGAGGNQFAGGGVDPSQDDAIGSKVRCTGSNCEIERGLVDQLLSNTTALATSARFVPSVKDGRPNGFKLYAIRPGSIFARIQLQNGDTIKGINGIDMTTPDQALAAYTKLRSASHLTVTVERHGETVTLDYTIR